MFGLGISLAPDFVAGGITCFTMESIPVQGSGTMVDSMYLAKNVVAFPAGWGQDHALGLDSHANAQKAQYQPFLGRGPQILNFGQVSGIY